MGAQQQQQDDVDDQDAAEQDHGKPDGADEEQEGIEMQQDFDGAFDDVQKDRSDLDQEVCFPGEFWHSYLEMALAVTFVFHVVGCGA